MKAKLISYSAKGLGKTEASKLSKALVGYIDKSNRAKYTYQREGLLTPDNSIIISKSTFIVKNSFAKKIISFILAKKAKISSWDIEIPEKYFKD